LTIQITEPMHPDFVKIYRQFLKRYCGSDDECEEGKSFYYGWLKRKGLDDTKPYRSPQEAFKWAQPIFQLIKEDPDYKYHKVWAAFPLSSMNLNVYTEDELLRGARTIIGRPVNVNHNEISLVEASIIDAEYEDGAVECVLKVQKNSELNRQIESGEIAEVSIEASCLRGVEPSPEGSICQGLVFTGLALLTKDVLPGIPLTRIEPVERLFERVIVTEVERMSEKVVTEEEQFADLPDSDFACIIQQGDTKVRKLPIPDCDHVQNAMARFNQTEGCQTPEVKAKICRKAKDCGMDTSFAEGGFCYEESVEKGPCESAKESLLRDFAALKEEIKEFEANVTTVMLKTVADVADLADRVEALTAKPEAPVTKEQAMARFRELRGEGVSKTDAYRLTLYEMLEKAAQSSKDKG